MNNVLKQRLIGALILVALGVIFWPIIFVEPEARGGLNADIPPRPGIDTAPLSPPSPDGLRTSPPLLDSGSESGDQVVIAAPAEPADDQQVASATTPDAPVEPAAPAQPAPERQAAESTDVIAAAARDEPPVQPKLDEQGVPIAWMLQVISVSQKDSAEATRDSLSQMGYKAYVKPAEVNGKTVYRVYVGPKFERAKLEAIQADVDKQFGVKSMVRRYYP